MSYNTGSQAPSTDWKFHAFPALDVEGATAKIKEGEASYTFKDGELGIVSRCDTVQVASNDPIEDYLVSADVYLQEKGKWHFWAVYDGHSGRHTSSVLSHSLIPYVARSLNDSSSEETAIEAAMVSAFTTLDNDISADCLAALNDAKTHAEVQARLAPFASGSCALLVAYDPTHSVLRVANTGDSRAVLGRRSTDKPGTAWSTIALSNDHAAANPVEAERVKALHPDEPDLITKRDGDCERFVGIAVTRAFGDLRWKWPLKDTEIVEKQYSGKPAPKPLKSLPYLEATPEVTATTVQKDDFLIMASDGLWNHLSSEGAVHAVGLWIDAMKAGNLNKVGSGPEIAVDGGPALEGKAEGISFWEYWKVNPENFVVEDDNAATHLVKNAFGGTQRQLFTGVMTVYAPTSKTMRDDVSVQVIFFGDV
ncbi:MAG: hypothetical protein MMC33_001086 [Icmadophila ericetorum]|nr:hypothetical protein [Icmadophila ericetorum]